MGSSGFECEAYASCPWQKRGFKAVDISSRLIDQEEDRWTTAGAPRAGRVPHSPGRQVEEDLVRLAGTAPGLDWVLGEVAAGPHQHRGTSALPELAGARGLECPCPEQRASGSSVPGRLAWEDGDVPAVGSASPGGCGGLRASGLWEETSLPSTEDTGLQGVSASVILPGNSRVALPPYRFLRLHPCPRRRPAGCSWRSPPDSSSPEDCHPRAGGCMCEARRPPHGRRRPGTGPHWHGGAERVCLSCWAVRSPRPETASQHPFD